MGLFDRFKKSECLVCGKEIGALGKRKIDDGYICKECAGKLSPFYTGRKRSTLDDIRAQLEYREANKADVEAFQAARTLGLDEKVMIDNMHSTFGFSAASWPSADWHHRCLAGGAWPVP